MRQLCIRSEIHDERPTPTSDQTLRREYQMQRLVRGMGQRGEEEHNEWPALALEWANRFLDQQRIRSVAETTLRSYAYDLLHFLRWWVGVTHTTAITEKTLTESTLLDYIRFQTNQRPQPAAADPPADQ